MATKKRAANSGKKLDTSDKTTAKKRTFPDISGQGRDKISAQSCGAPNVPGLNPAAMDDYLDCIRRQQEVGYYSEADENIRIRYANELVNHRTLEARAAAGGYEALVQVADSGYEQRSALAMHLEKSRESLMKYEIQLMLTAYQRKKGDTSGRHKKEMGATLDINDLLG